MYTKSQELVKLIQETKPTSQSTYLYSIGAIGNQLATKFDFNCVWPWELWGEGD